MRIREDNIYIVGHKNPDTDSICAAISYAYLKNAVNGTQKYVACRAGQINEETDDREWTAEEEREAFLYTSKMNTAHWLAENKI